MKNRMEGMRVGWRRRSSCPRKDNGGFDRSGVGVDGEKRGCFHCVSEVESTGFRVLLSND